MGNGKLDDVYVALLRGINVGGKNSLSMKDLVSLFERSGCENVATYIQSGNVVFRASKSCAARVPTAMAEAIFRHADLKVPVVLRTGRDLLAVAQVNPFLIAGLEPEDLHVMFLADEPLPARVGMLDPLRSPPDAFQVRGRHVYVHCPNGVGKSKLTNAYFDAKLGTTSTMRNWRTVLKLTDMVKAA